MRTGEIIGSQINVRTGEIIGSQISVRTGEIIGSQIICMNPWQTNCMNQECEQHLNELSIILIVIEKILFSTN